MGIFLKMTWGDKDKPLPKTLPLTFLSLTPKFLCQVWWVERKILLSSAPAHPAPLTKPLLLQHTPSQDSYQSTPPSKKFLANMEDFSPYFYTFIHLIFIDEDAEGLSPKSYSQKVMEAGLGLQTEKEHLSGRMILSRARKSVFVIISFKIRRMSL